MGPPGYGTGLAALLSKLAPAAGGASAGPGIPPAGPPGPPGPPGAGPPPPAMGGAPMLPPAGGMGITPQQAYDQQRSAFVKAAAQDYIAGQISHEDLHKASAYVGTEPYSQWKQTNVRRLKAAAKSEG